ncbi:MAG: hypothetical protein JSU87_00955 [Gemmatimonadota bacterium]|nr:MAG: hypothetical protein JSU87_00955 [Gemmatimonadota bacterium]
MWFEYKKSVAPIYRDETYRRMFATASGRPRKKGDPDEQKGLRAWFSSRLGRRKGDATETGTDSGGDGIASV